MKNKRMIYGVICIALAAIICLVGIPALINATNQYQTVVRAICDIDENTQINETMLEVVEVGSQGMTAVVSDISQVVGMYASSKIYAGDYFTANKLSKTSTKTSTDMLSTLTGNEGDKKAVTVTLPAATQKLMNRIKKGDIITLYTIDDDGNVTPIPEFTYVKLDQILNGSGVDVSTIPAGSDVDATPTALLLLLGDTQLKKAIEINATGTFYHMALVYRSDGSDTGTAKVNELLEKQEEILKKLSDNGTTSDTYDDDIVYYEGE